VYEVCYDVFLVNVTFFNAYILKNLIDLRSNNLIEATQKKKTIFVIQKCVECYLCSIEYQQT
jgi:hypothetical protein